jgi:hypothetical protein
LSRHFPLSPNDSSLGGATLMLSNSRAHRREDGPDARITGLQVTYWAKNRFDPSPAEIRLRITAKTKAGPRWTGQRVQ